MLYTQNVEEFVRHNNEEFRAFTITCCQQFHVDCVDDIVQELYFKFCSEGTLSKYICNNPYQTKFSSFIFGVVKNYVRNYRKLKRTRIEFHSLPLEVVYIKKALFPEELEYFAEVDSAYQERLEKALMPEVTDGLQFDLKQFERFLSKKNRIYHLVRKKDRSVGRRNLNLLRVFKLMRFGYTYKEIAQRYGVTSMFVSFLKSEIKYYMKQYGLSLNDYKSTYSFET